MINDAQFIIADKEFIAEGFLSTTLMGGGGNFKLP